MRKTTLLVIAALLAITLLGTGLQPAPSRAAGQPNDFPVTLEIVGVIQSITATQVTLADGTVVKLNKQTDGVSSALKAGVTVTIQAEMGDQDLVATSIALGDVSAKDATPDAGPNATPAATAAGPGKGNGNGKGQGQGDNGKGKGQGDDNDQGKGNGKGNGNSGGDDAGQGNGKGNSQGKGNGKGNGQGNNNGQGDNNGQGNGKGSTNDKQLAACLKNTKHPVVIRLAAAFDVPYAEIMTWHCQKRGFGEIARAYLLAKTGKMTVAQIFAARDSGKGWGQILQDAGVDPQSLAPGSVIKGKPNKGGKQ